MLPRGMNVKRNQIKGCKGERTKGTSSRGEDVEINKIKRYNKERRERNVIKRKGYDEETQERVRRECHQAESGREE